jgi:D-alanine-D-alanine ligase
MIKVGVLYGGRSGEHDVSRCSAASVVRFLDKSKFDVTAIGIDHSGKWYVQDTPEIIDDKDFGSVLNLNKTGDWFVNHYERDGRLYLYNSATGREIFVDVVFPVVHGTFCEDGTLQGLLELAMVPYVGADVIGSSIGMDKDVTKRLLKEAGVPVVDYIKIFRHEWVDLKNRCIDRITKELGYPCFVKPCNAGSSVGVSKVKNPSMLEDAINEALLWDNKFLVEKGVNAREIEFSIIGNEKPESSDPGEIRPKHEFYSYEAKYIDSDGAELIIPADISPELSEKMKKIAVDAYLALCCCGMARVDFFLDRDSGKFYCNEINTLPGFTSISMYPKLWERSGIKYSSLLESLIQLALERRNSRNRLRTKF